MVCTIILGLDNLAPLAKHCNRISRFQAAIAAATRIRASIRYSLNRLRVGHFALWVDIIGCTNMLKHLQRVLPPRSEHTGCNRKADLSSSNIILDHRLQTILHFYLVFLYASDDPKNRFSVGIEPMMSLLVLQKSLLTTLGSCTFL